MDLNPIIQLLQAVAEKRDIRLNSARLLELLDSADHHPPMAEDLAYALRRYLRNEPEASEEAIVGMASLVLDLLSTEKPESRWKSELPADARGAHERWMGASGTELAREVARRIQACGPLSHLGLGEYDGRVDLRGFVWPQPDSPKEAYEGSQVGSPRRTGSLTSVDFAAAEMPALRFFRVRVANCRFDGVRLHDRDRAFASGIGFWSSTVTDSSFRGADLSDALLDGVTGWPRRRCSFQRVDFSGANLANVWVSGSTFQDCDFAGAYLRNTEFASDLIRCRFAGHLHSTLFYGKRPGERGRGRLEDVDFLEADFHWVSFRGLNLDRVWLPAGPGHIRIDKLGCVAERLRAKSRSDPGAVPIPLRVKIEEWQEWRSRDQTMDVIGLRDLEEGSSREEVEASLQLLDDARRACQ